MEVVDSRVTIGREVDLDSLGIGAGYLLVIEASAVTRRRVGGLPIAAPVDIIFRVSLWIDGVARWVSDVDGRCLGKENAKSQKKRWQAQSSNLSHTAFSQKIESELAQDSMRGDQANSR